MEKISINDFAKICIQKMHFLCDKHDYILSEIREKSQKKENGIIHKLIFINNSFQRIIELVLIAEDYTTHMFSRIAGVYIKKKSAENNKCEIPDYYDAENCFEIFYIERLLPKENQQQLSLMYEKRGWSTYDYLESIKYIIENSSNIIRGFYFPTTDDLTKTLSEYYGREYKYIGRSKDNAFTTTIKQSIRLVENYGYEIIYDEGKLQPYERDDFYPKIKYFNKQHNILISISLYGRDRMISAIKNYSAKNYFHCGYATLEEYKNLERKMINEVLKQS